MDKAKAQKAVKKADAQKQIAQAIAAQHLALAMQGGAQGIDPEIQSPQIDLQPADGYVNPYHMMGTVGATTYSPGNILDGYNYPMMMNPET